MRPMVALEVEMIVHDTNGDALGRIKRIESHEEPYSKLRMQVIDLDNPNIVLRLAREPHQAPSTRLA